MNSPKMAVASALRPILDEFCGFEGQILKSVWLIREDSLVTGVAFTFDQASLTVKANAEDDTVEISSAANDKAVAGNATNVEPWATFIGEPFGWGWVTVNQQGYCDGVLLSFRGITPQLLLSVSSSSIEVSTIKSRS
jgi:hypothetical protein